MAQSTISKIKHEKHGQVDSKHSPAMPPNESGITAMESSFTMALALFQKKNSSIRGSPVSQMMVHFSTMNGSKLRISGSIHPQ